MNTQQHLAITRQLLKTARRERQEALEALHRAQGKVEMLSKHERELVERVSKSGAQMNWWTVNDDIPELH